MTEPPCTPRVGLDAAPLLQDTIITGVNHGGSNKDMTVEGQSNVVHNNEGVHITRSTTMSGFGRSSPSNASQLPPALTRPPRDPPPPARCCYERVPTATATDGR